MDHIEFYRNFPLLPPQSLDPLKADGYIEIGEVGMTELSVKHTSKFYSRIIDECDKEVGWDNVESFDKELQIMTIMLIDEAKKEHKVYVDFASENFSSDIDENSVSMEFGLKKYMDVLRKKCEQLADCWALLDDVDSSLCVLQPQNPKRSELWRRLAVSDFASALLEVVPDLFCPQITVYGPNSIAAPLNAKVKGARGMWNGALSARANLEAIFDFPLPEPGSFNQKDIKLECGICFSYRAENEDADQICSSDPCAQPFHRKCLVQWLTTKEDTRQSYNTYFGKCPYCSENIIVTSK
ncbi:hypothetical protein GGI26_000030 [Coemansia sp. RSA 1358]|nr:hypothetical protein GGI26_000030 [Coemansia sp. RSA 1358]